MYIEEQMIDGILHVRYSPDDKFKPYTVAQLSQRVAYAEKQLSQIRAIVN